MKNIDLSKLQNAEHLALMSDVLGLIKEANLASFNEIKEKMTDWVEREEAAQVQIRKNENTEKLNTLDEKRDRLYRGLVLRAQSEELSINSTHQEHAKKVLVVISTYGNFTAHNYQKETTDIQNFIADLKSDEYISSVRSIGLEEWVNALETANNDFHQLYTSRRDEYAAQPTYDLKNIRKELNALFRKFQQMAEALQILQPSEALTTLVAKTNVSITKWKDILAQRKGKIQAANSKTEEKKN